MAFITKFLADLRYVSFGISGNLIITQGNSNSLVLEGDADDLEKIDLFVECNTLNTHISGSGKIYIEGNSDKMDLHISGSG